MMWPCGHPRTDENTQRIGKAGPRCKQCRRRIARESARRKQAGKVVGRNKELMERRMTEVEKYTVEMWQYHLGRVVNLMLATEKRRRAFIDGFNGLPADEVHYTAREAWERGRQSSVLLGYIPASAETPNPEPHP